MSAGNIQTSSLVAPVVAYAGMLCDDSENDLVTAVNNDTVSMPFGAVVAFKTSSPPSDFAAILPAANNSKLMGIVVQEHDYERTYTLPDGTTAGQLDGTGLTVGTPMTLLRRGCIWVTVQQNVAPGDRLWVSFQANVVFTAAGQCGNADESSNTVIGAHQIGQFMSTATAGNVARLRVDFDIGPASS